MINFTLGTPKHLHDKLFNEYNFYYGFSKFAAYFINKYGEIYVCSPVIPHNFQSQLQNIDSLRFHFNPNSMNDNDNDNSDDEENENEDDDDYLLYDSWLNQKWNISTLNDTNNGSTNILNESILNQSHFISSINNQQIAYATYNAKAQFIDFEHNQDISRDIYRLNIAVNNNEKVPKNKHMITCTKIVMLDLDSFLFNDQLKQTQNRYTTKGGDNDDDGIVPPKYVLPIFVRIWSDHSIDIVCCKNPIHPSFSAYNDGNKDEYDAIVISKNYLDFNDNGAQNEFFMIQKCIQNLDELIFGHALEGLYRLKMNWLNKIGFGLNKGLLKYFELLSSSQTNIDQVPLDKFYMNSPHTAYNALLSDLCISRNNYNETTDQLIILDENQKQIHAFPLFSVNMNGGIFVDDDEKEQKEDIKINIDSTNMNMMKPFDIGNVEEIKNKLHGIIFNMSDMRFPSDFSLENPESLRWFVDNIKLKMENEIFSKLEFGHLMMNERKLFIENQLREYIEPQIKLIKDKIKQIGTNNQRLREKIGEILEAQKSYQQRIANIKMRMKETDALNSNKENNHSQQELIRYKSILEDYEQEYNALNYDFQQLNQYKIPERYPPNIQYGQNKDLQYLTNQIKESLKNSNTKIQQMANDKVGLDALQSRLSQR